MAKLEENSLLIPAAIEKIDKIITQVCLSGEKHIRKRPTPWWSISLHHTRYEYHIINKALKNAIGNNQLIQMYQVLLASHGSELILAVDKEGLKL